METISRFCAVEVRSVTVKLAGPPQICGLFSKTSSTE